MSWEYRLVKSIYPETSLYEGQILYEIKEVYYDKEGNIHSYGDAPVPYGETKKEVKECLDITYAALEKEIIVRR